jgi:hypothetical protein
MSLLEEKSIEMERKRNGEDLVERIVIHKHV